MRIEKAVFADLKPILELQYLAYQSEGLLLNTFSIPPLLQTLEDIQMEFQKGIFLKAVDENDTIMGSVRGHINGKTLMIGKLIVHPDQQHKGIGTRLLHTIEELYPRHRYELFTSDKSIRNLQFYEHLGYLRYREFTISPILTLIYLEKNPLSE